MKEYADELESVFKSLLEIREVYTIHTSALHMYLFPCINHCVYVFVGYL